MKKLYMLVAFLLGCFMYAAAQNVTVKGTVTDDHNLPLPGVNVKVSGTTGGTSTSVDGNYSISAPAGSSLVFSFIGFVTQTVKANKAVINIVLQTDQHILETVTVTALGIEQKTKSLTYATQNVGGAELEKAKDPNFVNSLAGKAAGLVITKGTGGPGSESRIDL